MHEEWMMGERDASTYRLTSCRAARRRASKWRTAESLESRDLLARSDAYFAAAGETLAVVASEGVLANDRLDNDPALTATLITTARHGQVTLQSDGSFRYVAAAGYVGDDRFEYQTSDGSIVSPPTLVSLQVIAHPVVINEVVSANTHGVRTSVRLAPEDAFTGDPQAFDWIELRNLADRPIDISQFSLSDDSTAQKRWQIPSGTQIAPGGYEIIWASGEGIVDRRLDQRGWLHTDFRLASAGDYLALVDAQGGIVQEIAPALPHLPTDTGFGLVGTEYRYLVPPTPGSTNSVVTSYRGVLSEPIVDQPHGFYREPVTITWTAAEPGSTIRYTLDGSEPTLTNGLDYTGPLTIATTSVLRAASFQTDFVPSPIVSQTYIFLQDVVHQSPNGTPPVGWPDRVNQQRMNYGMDPEIVDAPDWGPQLVAALTDIPSLSLVTDRTHLFDARTGIYVNAIQDGINWERPASFELINPDGSKGFQINAGLRIRGGFSRNGTNPKHSFRLFFRGEYGDARLNYPLFAEEGADSFQQIDLRTAQNNAWQFGLNNNSFLRDTFSRDTQRDMQQPYKRSRYYHLYLNGQYWGLYETDERAESDFAATYFGGQPQDYDVVKAADGVAYASSGTLSEWNRLWEISNHGFESNVDYFAVQGKNPNGTDNLALERHVDVDNLIDYMLLTFYTGNSDGPTALAGINNFYAVRNRESRDAWKFFAHDSEHTLISLAADNTKDSTFGQQKQYFNPRWLHQRLMANAEYRQRFADRAYERMSGDGALSPEKVRARLEARIHQLEKAIIAESARWGDVTRTQYTKTDWLKDVSFLLDTLTPARTQKVITQLMQRGAYSAMAPPTMSPAGGRFSTSVTWQLSAPAGTLYYTLDGSDPRAMGGAVNSTASIYVTGSSVTLDADVTVKARAWDGTVWSPLVESHYEIGAAQSPVALRVSEVHYHPAGPNVFEVAAGWNDADEFEFVELVNPSSSPIDLSGVKLVKSTQQGQSQGIDFDFSTTPDTRLAPGERIVVVENTQAFRKRYGDQIRVAGEWTGGLSNRSDTLSLWYRDQLLQRFTYQDSWYLETDGIGASLELFLDPTSDPARWNEAESWRPSVASGGTPAKIAVIPGDVTGDRIFDENDLLLVFQHGEYEDDREHNSSFHTGDWNGDGEFTTLDLVFAFQYGIFRRT